MTDVRLIRITEEKPEYTSDRAFLLKMTFIKELSLGYVFVLAVNKCPVLGQAVISYFS